MSLRHLSFVYFSVFQVTDKFRFIRVNLFSLLSFCFSFVRIPHNLWALTHIINGLRFRLDKITNRMDVTSKGATAFFVVLRSLAISRPSEFYSRGSTNWSKQRDFLKHEHTRFPTALDLRLSAENNDTFIVFSLSLSVDLKLESLKCRVLERQRRVVIN